MTILSPFAPKGDRPEWKMLYDDLLGAADFGDVITYEMLDDVLGRSFIANRGPLYHARTILGELRSRWIESVPKVGYRVIEANEHVRAANARKRRARCQLGMMMTITRSTDLARLTPEELQRYDAQSRINAALYGIAISHERRLSAIESVLRADGKL